MSSAASLAAHTPGPWRPDRNTNGNPYGISAYREGFRGAPIVVWRGIARPASAEGHANARLIAAAPELLAHLQVASAALKSVARQHSLTGTGAAIIDAIDGVIAKALGPSAADTSDGQASPGMPSSDARVEEA